MEQHPPPDEFKIITPKRECVPPAVMVRERLTHLVFQRPHATMPCYMLSYRGNAAAIFEDVIHEPPSPAALGFEI